MQRSSEAVQHGSFASIPPVCRQREQGKESIFSHTSLPETSITTCLARRPRAPRHRLVRAGACSATARAKSAVVFGGPGDFAIISRALPPPLSLLNLLPPFRAPSLLSQSTAFCQRPPGDPQIPAHAHTHTPTDLEKYSPLAKLLSPPDTLGTPWSSRFFLFVATTFLEQCRHLAIEMPCLLPRH